jgi:hypothetical protein
MKPVSRPSHTLTALSGNNHTLADSCHDGEQTMRKSRSLALSIFTLFQDSREAGGWRLAAGSTTVHPGGLFKDFKNTMPSFIPPRATA